MQQETIGPVDYRKFKIRYRAIRPITPPRVLHSCMNGYQLVTAIRWIELYLKREGIERSSQTARLIFGFIGEAQERLGAYDLRKFLCLAILLVTGCNADADKRLDDVQRYSKRAARAVLFCKNVPEKFEMVLADWMAGCFSGYMGHCSATSCPERKD